MSSRARWIANLKALTEFCRPLIVELFGHGRSPSLANPEAYFPESYICGFEAIRNEVGIESWFVCGQSLGAALTIRYSLTHPKRITTQIFTNSLSAWYDIRENRNSENIEKLVKSMLQRGRGVLDRLHFSPSQNRFLDPEIKKALIKDIDLINLEGCANNLIHLIPRCSVRNLLHEITVPTLLMR